MFEGAEVVAVVGHEVFDVDVYGRIIDTEAGFVYEDWIQVQLVNDHVGQHECEEEAEDEREDQDFDETAFFEIFIGEACESLPLFAENFIAVPYEADKCGHEGRDEDCDEIHKLSGLVKAKHKQKNRFPLEETVF